MRGSRSFAVAQDDIKGVQNDIVAQCDSVDRYGNVVAVSSLVKVAALLLCFFAASGCVMFNDSDEYENPSEDVARLVYINAVVPVLQFAELADFYEAYLGVRENADASGRLAEAYFGDTPVFLLDDCAEALYWGKISETSMDGVYITEFLRYQSYWAARYNVNSMGGRRYRIGCETDAADGDLWKEFMTDAVVSVSDKDIRIEEITIKYVDLNDVVISVTNTSEPVAAYRMLYPDNSIPYSGVLDFVVSGGIDDRFSLRFCGNSEFVVTPAVR